MRGLRGEGSTGPPMVRQSSVPAVRDPIRDLDFSRDAQKRVVRKATWLSGLTSYPLILGIMSGGAAIALEPAFFFFSVLFAAGGIIVGLGNAFYTSQYRAQTIRYQYLESLKQVIVRQCEKKFENLEKELNECGEQISGCERVAGQGRAQFIKGYEKLKNIEELLRKKLDPHELMSLGFSGTANQVYTCVLDNLRNMVVLLQSVSTINEEEIKMRLLRLEAKEKHSSLDEREAGTLREQLKLRNEKLEEVALLLIENEEALTGLDQTATTIAELDTGRREASVTMEQARRY
ncbi:MAG: hypothetical protein U1A23_02195 [Candidatus Sungbacteria bacterium]|nr:hypothetical protein [bacterium]MDZ4285717.1 hypothetical protein [Candidatus Sungbacteria bacterium]